MRCQATTSQGVPCKAQAVLIYGTVCSAHSGRGGDGQDATCAAEQNGWPPCAADHHARGVACEVCAKAHPDTLPAMAKGEGKGPGRPRTLTAEGDEDRARNAVIRLAERHRAELEALQADGHGSSLSGAVHWLIEESARRRARRTR